MTDMLHLLEQLALGLGATAAGAYTVVPRINARITEVTMAHEGRRTFRFKLTSVSGLSDRMLTYKAPTEASDVIVARIEGELERWRGQLDEHTTWLIDNLEWFALGYRTRLGVRALAADFAVTARGVFLSERADEEKYTLLGEITQNAHAVFAARRSLGNARKFLDALAALRQQLNELGETRPSTAAEVPAPSAPAAAVAS